MRTIKFRGKRIKDGHWVYGYLSGACQITTTLQSSEGNAVHLVKRETIGQFTGLFDNNGSEIYEGDIVSPTKYKSISNEVEYISNGFYRTVEQKGQKYVNPLGNCEVIVIGDKYTEYIKQVTF
jgi:uncharacterized phage protein (TIGR01671 family)